MRSIIRQVGLALPSHREMPSLLQRSHLQTEFVCLFVWVLKTHPITGHMYMLVRRRTVDCGSFLFSIFFGR